MTVPDPPTRGTPLRDRPPANAGRPDPAQTPAPRQRRRHVWVTAPDDGPEEEGLVLAWAQADTGWEALVVRVIDGGGRDIAVQEWLPAARLRPASPSP